MFAAIRTVCAFSSIYSCFPAVSFLTFPPYLFSGPGHYLIRCQWRILLKIPLCCNSRVYCCQVVFAHDNQLSCTIRTSTTIFAPICNDSPPTMPICAFPVHTSLRIHDNLVRCHISIFFIIPFSSQFRKKSCQIIITDQDFFICTVWTSSTFIYSLIRRCIPTVSFSTTLPDRLVRTWKKFFWRVQNIPVIIPLLRQLRMHRCQIIKTSYRMMS